MQACRNVVNMESFKMDGIKKSKTSWCNNYHIFRVHGSSFSTRGSGSGSSLINPADLLLV